MSVPELKVWTMLMMFIVQDNQKAIFSFCISGQGFKMIKLLARSAYLQV